MGVFLAVLCAAPPAEALDHEWFPVSRLAMGSALHVADPAGVVAYTLELSAGATWMPEPVLFFGPAAGTVFNVEAGYAFDGLGEGLHAFHFTAGLGYGVFFLAFVYQPRLIVGTMDDSSAIGMRNGLRGYYFADMVSLEVGHQFVHHHHGLHHDIHILLGVNPWALRTLR